MSGASTMLSEEYASWSICVFERRGEGEEGGREGEEERVAGVRGARKTNAVPGAPRDDDYSSVPGRDGAPRATPGEAERGASRARRGVRHIVAR